LIIFDSSFVNRKKKDLHYDNPFFSPSFEIHEASPFKSDTNKIDLILNERKKRFSVHESNKNLTRIRKSRQEYKEVENFF